VVRVDVNHPVPSLHYSGDKLVGMKSIVIAGENFLHSATVAARKPDHAPRVHVEFADPAETRHGTAKGAVDLVRMVLISGVVRGLVCRPFTWSRNRQDHIVGD